MKISLRSKKIKPYLNALKRLQKNNFEAYWVGGCVRDLRLRRPPKDFDITTSASPKDIAKLFPKHLKVGKKFGVFIVTEFGPAVEVATLRKDLPYRDGRRPIGIKRGTIKEDVLRRDFTINGLLYDPFQHKVIDLVKGANDLRKKIIRTIGNPNKRFQEDHLRMLRAIRFSVELDFKIEQEIQNCCG